MSKAGRVVPGTDHVPLVWIARDVIATIHRDAERTFPRETGGVLLGYADATSTELVVTASVGPGPLARHSRWAFVPDHKYQEEQVAKMYIGSGRIWTYLGDWHSHPDGPLCMSTADRRTLARIARFGEARLPWPVMAVIAGRPARRTIEPRSAAGSADETVVRSAEWQISTWRVSATPSVWTARIGRVALVLCSLRELD